MKKGQKTVFFAPDRDENHRLRNSRKRKGESEERGGRKEVKRKNYMHTKFLYYLFWSEKRLLEGRGLFSGNIYTNPAKYAL